MESLDQNLDSWNHWIRNWNSYCPCLEFPSVRFSQQRRSLYHPYIEAAVETIQKHSAQLFSRLSLRTPSFSLSPHPNLFFSSPNDFSPSSACTCSTEGD
ncbi:hypothetical protein CEXT_220121 [Caerostris extrusa]|uniref:Uncharacterized protein n=1 Tax=Caerostris extrusa TaxID=172846 RepID=A0AAV4NE96_CAEEX|nr:hypothetical protein CEXT_220121 [Caerostris extrusa]